MCLHQSLQLLEFDEFLNLTTQEMAEIAAILEEQKTQVAEKVKKQQEKEKHRREAISKATMSPPTRKEHRYDPVLYFLVCQFLEVTKLGSK